MVVETILQYLTSNPAFEKWRTAPTQEAKRILVWERLHRNFRGKSLGTIIKVPVFTLFAMLEPSLFKYCYTWEGFLNNLFPGKKVKVSQQEILKWLNPSLQKIYLKALLYTIAQDFGDEEICFIDRKGQIGFTQGVDPFPTLKKLGVKYFEHIDCASGEQRSYICDDGGNCRRWENN